MSDTLTPLSLMLPMLNVMAAAPMVMSIMAEKVRFGLRYHVPGPYTLDFYHVVTKHRI